MRYFFIGILFLVGMAIGKAISTEDVYLKGYKHGEVACEQYLEEK